MVSYKKLLILLIDRNIFVHNPGYSAMGGIKEVLSRWWDRVRYERRAQLKWGAFLMLFLSLLFSMGDGLISFFGWLSLGAMGFMMLYRRLERYFFLVLWLSITYILIAIGSLIAFSMYKESGNFFLLILGYSILMGSFLSTGYMWYFMKERRNLIALEGEYVPMGFYSIVLFFFFFIPSFFAVIGWIRWADGTMGSPWLFKALYFFAELILIPSMIYLSGYPEDRFKAPHIEFITDGGIFRNVLPKLLSGKFNFKKLQKREEKDQVCPLCNAQLKKEVKRCPSCDSPRFFYWCQKDEEYFIRCPNCRDLTPLGRERCIHCSIKMSSKIKCSKCSAINPASGWINN